LKQRIAARTSALRPSVASVATCLAVTVPAWCQPLALASIPPPAVTTALPTNIAGLVLLQTQPAAWQAIARFNPLPAITPTAIPLPFLPEGIDVAEDIQPWLGDRVAIALLPNEAESSNRNRAVLLAPVKNRPQLNLFLGKLKSNRGQPQIERDYKGVTLLYWAGSPATPIDAPVPPNQAEPVPSPPTKALKAKPNQTKPLSLPFPLPSIPKPSLNWNQRGFAIALLPNALAIATSAEPLEQLVDAQTSQKPLSENPLFQRTLKQPQFEKSLVVGYGNLEGLTQALVPLLDQAQQSLPTPLPLGSQLQTLTQTYSAVDFSLWAQTEGIRIQSNAYYTKPQPELAMVVSPTANQILVQLPTNTYVSSNSRNFKQQWQRLEQLTGDEAYSKLALKAIQGIVKDVTGLDLEEDLLPWMDGEYAVCLFPTTGGLFNYINPRLQMGLALMVQTSDRPAAEAALKKLDRHVQSTLKKDISLVTRPIKGQPFISWEGIEKGKRLSVVAHGWVNNDTVILTTGIDPMKVLAPQPRQPLNRNSTFQTATASFPQPNEGYFYVNMGATLSMIYGVLLPDLPADTKPFVQAVQQIVGNLRSVSSTNLNTAEKQQMDSLFVLNPKPVTRPE